MKPLSILYLEDNMMDVELIESRLEAEKIAFRMNLVKTRPQFLQALLKEPVDIVLIDYSVPGFEGLSALKTARQKLPDIPVIIVSGVIGEEIAIETLKEGATDYVLKQRISRLVPAIRRALEQAEEHVRRKVAEKALRDSEERYRAIFSNTGTATVIIDEEGTVCLANEEFEKLSGFSGREIEGSRRIASFFHAEHLEHVETMISDQYKNHVTVPRRSEFHFICKKGEPRSVILTVSLIPGSRQSVVSLLDVTELKKKEQALKRSLQEKEELLKEIHHRVKNNLQIMCSLLTLQASKVDEEHIRWQCQGCRDRIYTMSFIHEQLYMSKDLSNINFRESVESLVNILIKSIRSPVRANCVMEMEDVFFPISISIPLALIINELVANAIRHAFPDGRKGGIRIALRPVKGNYEFIIQDDGIGLPAAVDLKKTNSLGLHLVHMLVQQIKGRVAVTRSKGTKYKIVFPMYGVEKNK